MIASTSSLLTATTIASSISSVALLTRDAAAACEVDAMPIIEHVQAIWCKGDQRVANFSVYPTGCAINQSVTGSFQEDKVKTHLLTFLDECTFAGGKKQSSVLKGLSSETKRR